MYLLQLFNHVRPIRCQARLISNYPTLRDSKVAAEKPKVAGEQVSDVDAAAHTEADSTNATVNIGRRWVTPTKSHKRILVWTKFYKSVDEVPDRVKYDTLQKAESKFRIRCANWMMIFTLTCLFLSVKWGKKRAEQGESIETMNIEWHTEINKDRDVDLNKTKKVNTE